MGDENWAHFGAGFEAFDLPWKAEASGLPIEKSWGLFDPARKPHPAAEVWKASFPPEKLTGPSSAGPK